MFYSIDARGQCYKTFKSLIYLNIRIGLQCSVLRQS